MKKIKEGASGPKKARRRFLISITKINTNAPSQAMFSIAAKTLDALVVSIKMSGRKRKVAAIYGARQAIQNNLSVSLSSVTGQDKVWMALKAAT